MNHKEIMAYLDSDKDPLSMFKNLDYCERIMLMKDIVDAVANNDRQVSKHMFDNLQKIILDKRLMDSLRFFFIRRICYEEREGWVCPIDFAKSERGKNIFKAQLLGRNKEIFKLMEFGIELEADDMYMDMYQRSMLECYRFFMIRNCNDVNLLVKIFEFKWDMSGTVKFDKSENRVIVQSQLKNYIHKYIDKFSEKLLDLLCEFADGKAPQTRHEMLARLNNGEENE